MEEELGTRTRVREGFGIAIGLFCLVAALFVLLLVMGLWKRMVRTTAPTLVDLPGGSWTAGAVLGLITVLGVAGGLRWGSGTPSRPTVGRTLRALGATACWAAAFAAPFYLLSALPGKNCRSYEAGCAYIPGTGSALVACVVSAGLLGWVLFRMNRAARETEAARERDRLRRLRKKGKGKSRAAGGR
jgi:hypothetical protein